MRARPLVAAALALGAALWLTADRDAPSAGAAQARAPAAPPATPLSPIPPAPQVPEARDAQRRRLLAQWQLADRTYCSYAAATRYPPESRPIAERADQDRPNDPVMSAGALRLDGGGADERVQVRTSQSRVYLASGESATLALQAADAGGNVLPLVVTRAVAQGVTIVGTRPNGQLAIPFADDGAAPDARAEDGVFTGMLAPGHGPLAGFDGTIRTEVRFNAGGRSGVVQFDVVYSPQLPAVWTGPAREVVEDGALAFRLPLDVRQAGRYIVSGRVDDALGRPFALLTFNEVLGPGPNEVLLPAFGKLVRDGQAALPLTLRDVEGYLLREDRDPDRALLPRLQGRVATGTVRDPGGLSDAEWQSEERTRYLTEFARELKETRSRLAAFDPTAPLPPSACASP
ncbi:choice-of-anchor X domain-containing protein [Massilia sp. TN1-12]|uniref:choice-of-anchor X domain-containing protein n=1 Tax=Massilia paldalensis TaxID=3377675 RepID=UPI003850F068